MEFRTQVLEDTTSVGRWQVVSVLLATDVATVDRQLLRETLLGPDFRTALLCCSVAWGVCTLFLTTVFLLGCTHPQSQGAKTLVCVQMYVELLQSTPALCGLDQVPYVYVDSALWPGPLREPWAHTCPAGLVND